MRILPSLFRLAVTGILGCSALLAFTVAPVSAQATYFADRASFTAAGTGLTTVDFEDEAVPNDYTYYETGTLTKGGVTFTTDNLLFAIGAGFQEGNDFGTGAVLSAQTAVETDPTVFTAFLPENTTAVGLEFGDWYASDFTVSVGNGSTSSSFTLKGGEAPSVGGFKFAGFTSDTPLTFISFTNPAGTVASYDNFTYGTAISPSAGTEAPEPGSLALLLPLMGGVGAVRTVIGRRKRR